MRIAYVCDSCDKVQILRRWIFTCLYCEKEICEDCMHGYATCKECAKGKTEQELSAKFNEEHL